MSWEPGDRCEPQAQSKKILVGNREEPCGAAGPAAQKVNVTEALYTNPNSRKMGNGRILLPSDKTVIG